MSLPDGRVVRPAQDGRDQYGRGIVFQEITIDGRNFHERPIAEVGPSEDWPLRRRLPHTHGHGRPVGRRRLPLPGHARGGPTPAAVPGACPVMLRWIGLGPRRAGDGPASPRVLHDSDGLIVAVLVGSGGLGGAERSTIELAAADRAAGGRFVVLARDRGDGAISSWPTGSTCRWCAVKGLVGAVRVLRHLRPSVVWPFGLRWSLSLRLLVQRPLVHDPRGRRPVVFAAQRGLDTWRRPWHNVADAVTQRLVDRFVANSEAARSMLVDTVGIDPDRAVALWSGVSDEWLGPLRPRQGCDVVRVIVVGTNRDEKGHPDALVALAALVGRDDWVATVYTERGDGPRPPAARPRPRGSGHRGPQPRPHPGRLRRRRRAAALLARREPAPGGARGPRPGPVGGGHRRRRRGRPGRAVR